MRNWIIAVLIILVLGLGGWLIYNKTKSNNTTSSSTASSNTPSQSSTADVLNMSNQGLTAVGPNIYNQTTVTSLDLSYNNLKTLPSQMGKMTDLQELKLDHNLLEGSLIGEVRLMPLTTLDVSYNNMTGIPAEIGQLNKLVTLNYSYNKITGLPKELANLKNNLKTFNLTGNPLTTDQINQLSSELPNTNVIY